MNSLETNNKSIPKSNLSSSESQQLSQMEVLSLIKEEKYTEALTNLRYTQLNTLNYYQSSNNWNIFFIKIIKENKSSNTFSSDLIQSISSFFDCINNNSTLDSFPVIKLNEIIFYFSIGKYSTMINRFKRHITKQSFDYILFVNSILILIETCLMLNLNNMAEQFISHLDYYFECSNNHNFINGFSLPQEMRTIDKITTSYNNDKTIAYYNDNKLYHKDTNMNKEIILLLKCNMHLNQFQFDKALKTLNDFKSIYSISHLKTSASLYEQLKRMYNIFKIRLDYLTSSQLKFYKHIDYLCDNYSDKETNLFKYNSYGILNLKMKNVKCAEYYFLKGLVITESNQRLKINYWHCLIFNLALCSFYSMKYDKCYKRLISLKDNESISSNPFYYYRLGLCLIEREFKAKRKQEDHSTIVNQFIKYSSIYSQTEGGEREEDNEVLKPSITNQCKYNNKCINKRIVLNQESKMRKSPLITEAIDYFKQCLLLLKGYNCYQDELNIINETLHKEYEGEQTRSNIIIKTNNKVKNKYDKNDNSKSFSPSSSLSLKKSNTKNSYNKILSSAISHLLFCFILTANYTEVIYYGRKLKNNIEFNSEQNIINNYLAEAYIHLGQTRNAMDILLNNNTLNDNKGSVYSINSNVLYSEIKYKLALQLNLLKINFLQGNKSEVEKGISQILNSEKKNELPPYITYMLLYYYLSTRQTREAIALISYRQISDQFK